MQYIAIPVLVWICIAGFYSILELFVRRKERLALIDRLGGDAGSEFLQGKLKLGAMGRDSFGAMKIGMLLIGLGLGLLVGFMITNHYFPVSMSRENELLRQFRDMREMIYAASMLIFGGAALLGAFLIEYKLSKK